MYRRREDAPEEGRCTGGGQMYRRREDVPEKGRGAEVGIKGNINVSSRKAFSLITVGYRLQELLVLALPAQWRAQQVILLQHSTSDFRQEAHCLNERGARHRERTNFADKEPYHLWVR
jgi:hypothetical protein